jgi:hypothetical protein
MLNSIRSPLDGIRSPFGPLRDSLARVIALLFSNNEPGFLTPISPSVCFTDTAGTTQAQVGQAVALVNDRSGRGNNWTQPTLANRPILGRKPKGGRRNLLTFTEQFDNAAWTKANSNAVANSTTAPDGATTADKLVENSATSDHFISNPATTTAAAYTFTVYAKAAERNWLALLLFDSGGTARTTYFDVQNGVVGTVGLGVTASIEALPNGWYRCRATIATALAGTATARVYLANGNTVFNYTGDGTSGLFLWGAQLELGSTATPYQRVTTRFDVTEAGKADCHYLFCGGSADPRWMQTPTITPGTDKVQVFAGVRKLSDAAFMSIAETSADLSPAGIFSLAAPSNQYRFGSKGNLGQANATTSSVYGSPVTNVIAGIGDISTDVSILRIDGVQVATSATDQGTGNYLAHPTFIGARGGTSFYFNGEIYALGVRFGPNLDTATIEKVEQYVASLVAEPTI